MQTVFFVLFALIRRMRGPILRDVANSMGTCHVENFVEILNKRFCQSLSGNFHSSFLFVVVMPHLKNDVVVNYREILVFIVHSGWVKPKFYISKAVQFVNMVHDLFCWWFQNKSFVWHPSFNCFQKFSMKQGIGFAIPLKIFNAYGVDSIFRFSQKVIRCTVKVGMKPSPKACSHSQHFVKAGCVAQLKVSSFKEIADNSWRGTYFARHSLNGMTINIATMLEAFFQCLTHIIFKCSFFHFIRVRYYSLVSIIYKCFGCVCPVSVLAHSNSSWYITI